MTTYAGNSSDGVVVDAPLDIRSVAGVKYFVDWSQWLGTRQIDAANTSITLDDRLTAVVPAVVNPTNVQIHIRPTVPGANAFEAPVVFRIQTLAAQPEDDYKTLVFQVRPR